VDQLDGDVEVGLVGEAALVDGREDPPQQSLDPRDVRAEVRRGVAGDDLLERRARGGVVGEVELELVAHVDAQLLDRVVDAVELAGQVRDEVGGLLLDVADVRPTPASWAMSASDTESNPRARMRRSRDAKSARRVSSRCSASELPMMRGIEGIMARNDVLAESVGSIRSCGLGLVRR
jgi:hypothetical protein